MNLSSGNARPLRRSADPRGSREEHSMEATSLQCRMRALAWPGWSCRTLHSPGHPTEKKLQSCRARQMLLLLAGLALVLGPFRAPLARADTPRVPVYPTLAANPDL